MHHSGRHWPVEAWECVGVGVDWVYMVSARYVYWQDGTEWLGYFEEFPDYLTQGETIGDLQEQLKELWRDLTSGAIPGIRRVAELSVQS